MRPRNIVAFGTGLGLAVAVVSVVDERVSLLHGTNPAGVGFGVSHLLFVLGLPWSAGILVVMWAVLALLHADGPAAMRPFFYSMPIVAGFAWSAIVALIVDSRRVRRRASRPSA